ncbi:MAG: LacI family DNA-binding transcriptional regulator [Anaerolineae bacterium]
MKSKLSAIKLEHDSYIALHVQLHNALRQLIVSGRWQQGERIPSEPQLARHLNISRSTVRIALQKAEVEGLITRAAGRGTFVSYNPTERSNTGFIGYVTRSFHNEIHRVLLSSVETELRSEGYNVIFSNAIDNQEEVTVLKQLLQDNIRGLVLWANANITDGQRSILREYQASNIPIVYIDRFVDSILSDFVGCDNRGGTQALMQHLIELGHRHIVYLKHNTNNLFPVDERFRTYESIVHQYNLHSYDVWKVNSPNRDEFYETDIFQLLEDQNEVFTRQITDLIQQTQPAPTAIVCVNDALAILTMRAIRSMGLNVPQDISVVGFDDLSLAAYLDIPLTTVSQNAHQIGIEAAQILLERLDGSSKAHQHITVPTRLQIRMSTSTPIVVNHLLSDE